MTIQTDPRRCWVRIETDTGRILIGDAWRLEPFGEPDLADEFSLTISRRDPGQTPIGVGLRLNREEGTALRTAIDQWLSTPAPTVTDRHPGTPLAPRGDLTSFLDEQW